MEQARQEHDKKHGKKKKGKKGKKEGPYENVILE